jgi:two-component system chemotaxis response regulator CheB
MTHTGKTRVLIVDDSAIVRDLLEKGLSLDPDIEVVGKSSDAFSARDRIVILNPDVITLDIEMPRMNGIDFLRKLIPQYPIPVVVVSAVTVEGSRRAIEALEAGALDVVAKPSASDRDGFAAMIADLSEKVKWAAHADVGKFRRTVFARPTGEKPKTSPMTEQTAAARRLVAIGASTGGTSVFYSIIPQFPRDMPGVVIVQHMPPVFTRLFAEALDKLSAVEVREAKDGDAIRPGLVLIAPGDYHMTVRKNGLEWKVSCAPGEKVCGHRPSVDVLFRSVASAAGERAVGALLTGMGRDGADGMLAMRRSGARCIAQDEETSVVFGMPKEAWDNGAAEKLVPAQRLTQEILYLADLLPKLRTDALSIRGDAI